MKRGGYIQRRTPIRARRRMKRAAQPRRVTRPGVGSDPAYLAWVRGLPCLVAGNDTPCNGWPCHSHHAGKKTHDRTAIPLCFNHHNEWHSGVGCFDVRRGWNKTARRAWADVAIKVVQGWHRDATEETA